MLLRLLSGWVLLRRTRRGKIRNEQKIVHSTYHNPNRIQVCYLFHLVLLYFTLSPFVIQPTDACRQGAKLYISHEHSAPPLVTSPCATMSALTILGDPSKDSTYPAVTGTISRVEIFPPIGIARVGDSDSECFLAPEVTGRTSPPEGLRVGTSQVCFLAPQHTRSHPPLRSPGVQVSGRAAEAQTPGSSIHQLERLDNVYDSFIRPSASASTRTMPMAPSSANSTRRMATP